MNVRARGIDFGMDASGARDETAGAGAALIHAFHAGEARAFERLLRRYERLVFRVAFGVLGNEQDAQDAAQEAFMRCYRGLNGFDADRPMTPWLYSIVVNVCRDHYRRRQRENETHRRMADENRRGVSVSNGLETSDFIAAGLQRLTPRERMAIVLCDMEGLSSSEAAKAMGCAPVTARILAARARKKMYAFYQQETGGGR